MSKEVPYYYRYLSAEKRLVFEDILYRENINITDNIFIEKTDNFYNAKVVNELITKQDEFDKPRDIFEERRLKIVQMAYFLLCVNETTPRGVKDLINNSPLLKEGNHWFNPQIIDVLMILYHLFTKEAKEAKLEIDDIYAYYVMSVLVYGITNLNVLPANYFKYLADTMRSKAEPPDYTVWPILLTIEKTDTKDFLNCINASLIPLSVKTNRNVTVFQTMPKFKENYISCTEAMLTISVLYVDRIVKNIKYINTTLSSVIKNNKKLSPMITCISSEESLSTQKSTGIAVVVEEESQKRVPRDKEVGSEEKTTQEKRLEEQDKMRKEARSNLLSQRRASQPVSSPAVQEQDEWPSATQVDTILNRMESSQPIANAQGPTQIETYPSQELDVIEIDTSPKEKVVIAPIHKDPKDVIAPRDELDEPEEIDFSDLTRDAKERIMYTQALKKGLATNKSRRYDAFRKSYATLSQTQPMEIEKPTYVKMGKTTQERFKSVYAATKKTKVESDKPVLHITSGLSLQKAFNKVSVNLTDKAMDIEKPKQRTLQDRFRAAMALTKKQ